MLLDKTTEFISHFIGLFHITIEEERLRDVYEKFKALQDQDPESGPLINIQIKVHAPYRLEDVVSGVYYRAPDYVSPSDTLQPGLFYFAAPDISTFTSVAPLDVGRTIGRNDNSFTSNPPLLQLDPASSVAVVTYQTASLTDDDVLTFSGEIGWISPEVYLADLTMLAATASAVNVLEIGSLPALKDGIHGYATGVYNEFGDTQAPTLTGLNTTISHGSAAYGTHENGGTVTELSALDTLLPAHLQAEDAEVAITDNAPDSPGGDSIDQQIGQTVVSGGNLLVNETVINSNWLDAPVISVMGDVINIEAISQTNLLVNHDTFAGVATMTPSHVLNAAAITHMSSLPETDSETAATPTNGSLPAHWVVARLEADITSVNWVHQYSFATDTDRAEIQFSGTETYIGLGENKIINATSLAEIGFGYDLIIIGGHMISVSMISQTNVLLDSNHVTYSGGTNPGIDAGDNLLANSATLSSIGLDSYVEMTDAFANASESLADGALNITSAVAHQSYFEGVEVLRVLYIEGDFTTLNVIEQTNILGDADQVHLALAGFEPAHGGDITVTTGSNALINVASVSEYGVDSTVLVGGEVYSDALLYQAELIDTNANPLGVGINDLANEAVAFLAEGMLEPESPEELMALPTIDDGSTSPDVMQTMLA